MSDDHTPSDYTTVVGGCKLRSMTSTAKIPSVGDRIALIRQQRSISQSELRRRTGINVWRIEAGHYNPQIHTLAKLAAALDVKVTDFFS